MGVYAGPAEYWYNSNEGRTSQSTRMVVQDGLILNLDAGASTSYFGYWSPILSNGANAFDGSLSTAAGLLGGSTGPFTYTFLNPPRISSARMYVTFGATSNQVGATTNIFLVNGIDVTQKVKNANFYLTSGWIDVTSEAVSNWNTFQFQTINGVTNAGIYAIEVNGNVLVGNYSGTTWTDLSGNGKNGTLVNGVGFDGGNGGSLVFDGSNDYSRINSFGSDSNLAFSVFCWVYPKNLTTQQFEGNYLNWIINKRNITSPNSNSWQFSTFNSYPVVGMWDNNDTTVQPSDVASNSTSAFQLNRWYYTGFTTDGTNGGSLKIYINDSVNYSGTLTGNRGIATKPIDIGKVGWGEGYYWNGNIAQISIYNRALTEAEVQQNFNALRIRFGI